MTAQEAAARCAVLLRGGVLPTPALAAALTEGDAEGLYSSPDAVIVRKQLAEGATASEALAAADGPEWRLLGAAWFLAEQSGARFAPTLERTAAALRALDQLRDRRDTLLASPRMTVRLVSWLPPLALVLGAGLGFNPLPVLLSFGGAALIVSGLGLLWAGIAWARAMSRAAMREDRVAGLELELAWIALQGGAATGEALVRVADCVSRYRLSWVGYEALCAGGALRRTLSTASAAGVSVGTLLLEQADAARALALTQLESSAERLGVRVLVPLGVCVLPSFILLGVLPVLLSMIGGLG